VRRLLILALAVVAALSVDAARPKGKGVHKRPAAVPVKRAAAGPVETAHRKSPYVGAVSVDLKSGDTVFAANPDAEAYPASVTKLMTALLVLEDVKAGRYALASQVVATADVYRSEPSWVGLKVGEKMSVGDLLTALMVESANDAAIALAVNSAGSVEAFVAKMNAKAKALGMNSTVYYNPNGLPPNPAKRYPWKSFNVSTAADQAKLAVEMLRKHPSIIDFTSVKTCDLVKTSEGYRVSVTRQTNKGERATQLAEGEKLVKAMKNHNNVMRTDKLKIVNADGSEAVDGLKTGYIDAGGSSVVLTAKRGNRRVIVVVLGSSTSKERDVAARGLAGDALCATAW